MDSSSLSKEYQNLSKVFCKNYNEAHLNVGHSEDGKIKLPTCDTLLWWEMLVLNFFLPYILHTIFKAYVKPINAFIVKITVNTALFKQG